MKKVTGILAAIALTAAIFTGCQAKKVSIDVNSLANDLKSKVKFVDTLTDMNEAAFPTVYEVDSNDIKTKKVYIGSGATAEEIAVFEGTDEKAADRIKGAVDKHIEDNLESFEDYNPDEIKKLSDPVIVQKDKYVILCVSDDNNSARQCIEEYIK